MTYGDSYLTACELEPFFKAQDAFRMLIYRNNGAWDASNIHLMTPPYVLYKKAPDATHIDYGLLAFEKEAFLTESVTISHLADLLTKVSHKHQLAGFEVFDRFYEIGSKEGLQGLEEYMIPNSRRSKK